jgi:hypothetical protein
MLDDARAVTAAIILATVCLGPVRAAAQSPAPQVATADACMARLSAIVWKGLDAKLPGDKRATLQADLDRIVEECKGDLKIATASLVAFEQAVDKLIAGR